MMRAARIRGALTHGHSAGGIISRTYRSWAHMKDRCVNSKNIGFADYGGRGITICERWLLFANFLSDMGERPPGLTLDRKDNDKGLLQRKLPLGDAIATK